MLTPRTRAYVDGIFDIDFGGNRHSDPTLLDAEFGATLQDFAVAVQRRFDLVVEKSNHLLWGATDEGAGLQEAVELLVDGRVKGVATRMRSTRSLSPPCCFTTAAAASAVHANGFVHFLAVATGLHHSHDHVFGGHEGQLFADAAADHGRVHHHAFADILQNIEHDIGAEEGLGEADTAVGTVIEGALHPLHGGGVLRVGNQGHEVAGQGAAAFGARMGLRL